MELEFVFVVKLQHNNGWNFDSSSLGHSKSVKKFICSIFVHKKSIHWPNDDSNVYWYIRELSMDQIILLYLIQNIQFSKRLVIHMRVSFSMGDSLQIFSHDFQDHQQKWFEQILGFYNCTVCISLNRVLLLMFRLQQKKLNVNKIKKKAPKILVKIKNYLGLSHF